MKQLHKILKISAKESFKKIRQNSPYFSLSLHSKIYIGREFWNHINFSKYRTVKEIVYRLAIIPLLERIIEKGTITEKRKEDEKIFYRIEYCLLQHTFCIIIMYNSTIQKHSLISCFVKYNE